MSINNEGPFVSVAAFYDSAETDDDGNPLSPELTEAVTVSIPALLRLRLCLALYDFPDDAGAWAPIDMELISPSQHSLGTKTEVLPVLQPWNGSKYFLWQEFPVAEYGTYRLKVSYRTRLLTVVPLMIALPGSATSTPNA